MNKTHDAIEALAPVLLRLRHETLQGFHREPDAYVLPKSLDPGPYDGPGATDIPAVVLGRPVIWSDDERLGVFIEVPHGRVVSQPTHLIRRDGSILCGDTTPGRMSFTTLHNVTCSQCRDLAAGLPR